MQLGFLLAISTVVCTCRLPSRLRSKILGITLPRTFTAPLPLVAFLSDFLVLKGNKGRVAVRLLLRSMVSWPLDTLDAISFEGTVFPPNARALRRN